MNTTAAIAENIIERITDASPEVIEAIKSAPISDDAKMAMLYFADPEFRASMQEITAAALVAKHA